MVIKKQEFGDDKVLIFDQSRSHIAIVVMLAGELLDLLTSRFPQQEECG